MSTAPPPQAKPRTSPEAVVAIRESPPRKHPRQLSSRKQILFLLVMLSLSWISIEGMIFLYLRSSGFYWNRSRKTRLVNEMPNNLIPKDRYIWGYEPGSEFTYSDPREKTTYHVKVNSEGFRDEEPAARKGAAFQFVALGDSFTFGWMVEQQQRWDEVLAKVIRQKHGISSASVNRGMWMTTFDQHALILEDNFPRNCSAVIHFVYPSHLQTINRHTVKTRGNKIVSVSDPMLHLKDNALYFGAANSALVHKQLSFPFSLCLWNFHRNMRLLQEKIEHSHSVPEMTDEQIYQQKTQSIFQNGYDLMERSIAQTAALLKRKNIPYIVVIIPRDRQVNAAEWNTVKPIPEILNADVPQARIRAACEKTKYALVLDLLPAMRKYYDEKLYYKHDAHWRPEGHNLAAHLVLQLLEKRSILAAFPPTR